MASPGASTKAPDGMPMTQVDEFRTATSTVFVMQIPSVNLTYTFLSPITPNDFLRQSIPFAYLYVTAESRDGRPHTVSIYSDVPGEWLSGDPDHQTMNWTTTPGQNFVTHKMQLQQTKPMTEQGEYIQDGAVYFSAMGPDLTYRIGEDTVVRSEFVDTGTLTSTIIDNDFRPVSMKWPVLAFSVNLGTVMGPSQPAVFSIGNARMSMAKLRDTQLVPYYASRFTPDQLPAFVMDDFQTALKTAADFDAQVDAASRTISDNTFDIVALSIRQSLGATELVVRQNADGSYDTSTPMLFVKDMSRTSPAVTNPVDALYAMWPMLRYLNASLGLAALEPVLSFASSASPALKYAPSNLGPYPFASAPIIDASNAPNTPLEATADMVIMTLDAARQAHDTSQLARYFDLLNSWTKYLLDNTLHPADDNRFTGDTFLPGLADQTNLAVKGIIAIGAMSVIANMTNHGSLGTQYESTARDYAQQWVTGALSANGSNIKLQYSANASCVLAYNLYMDKLLGLDLIPPEVYAAQETFYHGQLAQFGLALNCNTQLSSTVWNMWTAALSRDTAFRAEIIDAVALYAGQSNAPYAPFPDVYSSQDGTPSEVQYKARPHIGGHLAVLLALDLSSDVPSTAGTPASTQSHDAGKNVATCTRSVTGPWILLICVVMMVQVLLG
ncbi:DUF1793-domain-containing protein [Exidia glandulosa HHB12029]|uniref:DUF1793-domain-containing protein n=1 Tax=Exidia glandulosa HHB12029 TaxID=1314781 RepID=A0A165E2F2_EXIGL|nr:DUF1793-domain-containing protein [Exidia glandulosa HHB12029]